MATLWLEIKDTLVTIYKKRAVENFFSPFSVFSLFQHKHDLYDKFYQKLPSL